MGRFNGEGCGDWIRRREVYQFTFGLSRNLLRFFYLCEILKQIEQEEVGIEDEEEEIVVGG